MSQKFPQRSNPTISDDFRQRAKKGQGSIHIWRQIFRQVLRQVKLDLILLKKGYVVKYLIRVGRQVKNGPKTSDVICECSPRLSPLERSEFRTSTSGFRLRLMAFFRFAVAHKNESKFQRCVWVGWCNIAIGSHCFSRELVTSIFFEVTNFYFWHGSLHFQTKKLVLLNHAYPCVHQGMSNRQ